MKLVTLAQQLHNELKTHAELEKAISGLELRGCLSGQHQDQASFQVYRKLCKERAQVDVEIEKARRDIEAIQKYIAQII